jgi:hypothetical protein
MTFQNIHLLTQSLYNLHSGDEPVNPAESLERLSLKNKLIKIGDDESNTNIVDIYIDYIPFLLKTLDFFAKFEVKLEQQRQTNNNSQENPSNNSRIIYKLFQHSVILPFAFNSLAFITGILKIYSNSELNRKKLLHANLFPSLKLLLEYYSSSTYVNTMILYPKLFQRRRSKDREENESGKGLPSKEMMNATIEKILISLSQVIIIIRNYSLEKSSREFLLQNDILLNFLPILTKFSYFSEIILNIARVLAKLTLYESFRNQINSKNVPFLDALVKIIRNEANKCEKIMDTSGEEGNAKENAETANSQNIKNNNHNNGTNSRRNSSKMDDDSDYFEESEEPTEGETWPEWYTWPMISRISFALGNLTTTNEGNR